MPVIEMEPKDIITAVAAVVGMVLGIYNFFHSRSADKVRLQVIPKSSAYRGNDHTGQEYYLHNRDHYDINHPTAPPETLSIEIINMSRFAVTVDEVGLTPSWSRKRMTLVVPIIKDEKPWPRKLEPRESVMVQFDATVLLELENIGSVRRAYATTKCGTACYGSSGALREFVRIARGMA